MVKRLVGFVFGVGVGVGLGASVMHKVDKAAAAAAEKASPANLAKRVGAGAASVASSVGEGWREARGRTVDVTDDAAPAAAAQFTVRPVRDLRAG